MWIAKKCTYCLMIFQGLKMKFFIVLSVVAFANCMDQDFLDKSKTRMTQYIQECMETAGATQDDLAEIMEIRIPSRDEGKCLLACYHKKYGIQNKDGKLDKAASIAAMKDLKAADPELYDKAVKLFDMCIDQVPNQKCECNTAAIFMYCFNINGGMMGLKPGMVPM